MLDKLLEKINIKPKNWDHYIEAFTHRTYTNENRNCQDYDRLEFLGDALIQLFVSQYIFEKHKNFSSGELTILRKQIVSAEALMKISNDLGLIDYLRVGKGANEVKKSLKTQSDLFEALSAAIFLDQGENILNKFFYNNLYNLIDQINGKTEKNPKTILQEYLQLESRENVQYKAIALEDSNWEVVVYHEGIALGRGIGKTKKEAEIIAARKALEIAKRE